MAQSYASRLALLVRATWLRALLRPCDPGLLPSTVQHGSAHLSLLIRQEKGGLARIVHNKVSLAFRVELHWPARWRLDCKMLPIALNVDRNSGVDFVLSGIRVQTIVSVC
jgi:hypothetical protein